MALTVDLQKHEELITIKSKLAGLRRELNTVDSQRTELRLQWHRLTIEHHQLSREVDRLENELDAVARIRLPPPAPWEP